MTTTITPVDHPQWDFRITVTDPRVSIICETFVSGGVVVVEATENRLRREMATILRACYYES